MDKCDDIIIFDGNFIKNAAYTIKRNGNSVSIIGSTVLPFKWIDYGTINKNTTLTDYDILMIYDYTTKQFLNVTKSGCENIISCNSGHALIFWGIFKG